MLEKTLESPLDCKEIKGVNCKGNQSWILFGSANAETVTTWPPGVKNWLIGKDWFWQRLVAGGEGEDRRWNADDFIWLNWCGFEQAPWVHDGQGSLVCHNPWVQKQLDRMEWLNGTHHTNLGSQRKESVKELSYASTDNPNIFLMLHKSFHSSSVIQLGWIFYYVGKYSLGNNGKAIIYRRW